MNSRRSASVGALPREKKHFVSRNESASGITLDVRCACQFFQTDSLLPERVNPLDSRPASKLGFLSECDHRYLNALRQPSPMRSDVGSTRSFNMSVHGHASPAPMEYDRLSVRSATGGPSSEHIFPTVDLAFVEKYPELEETARSRGLVVGNIASPEMYSGGDGKFLAGMRGRQMSVGALSAGMRDPDAISIRSGISVRRISRSPSKTDLFVADLNIPTTQTQREQRSISVSRRNSNMDLTQHNMPYSTSNTLNVTSLYHSPSRATGVTGATEATGMTTAIASPNRSPSPSPGDLRGAKIPLSTDYMRPSENRQYQGYHPPSGDLLPQHRPIDVQKYERFNIAPTFNLPNVHNLNDTTLPDRVTITANKGKNSIRDPLQKTVAQLEENAATRNVEDVIDYIQLETRSPPTEVGEIREPSLHLDEETQINIFSAVPIVDIEQLVHEEAKKAEEEHNRRSRPTSRQQSPVRKRQLSPGSREEKKIQTQLSDLSTEPHIDAPQTTQIHSPLKRQRASEQRFSPARSVTIQEPSEIQSQTIPSSNNSTNGDPNEAKPSYTTRFKSIFNHSTKTRDTGIPPKPSMNHQRKKSVSPVPMPSMIRESSASPKANKLLSMVSKPQPATIERVRASSTTLVTKDPKARNEPMSARVTETFSLKVDDMDQYSIRPKKPPPLLMATSSNDLRAHSHEDFPALERSSGDDLSEAFVPVVLSTTANRSPYSSELDVKAHRGRELSSSSQLSMAPKGQLFSAPINIDSTASPRLELFEQRMRSPSEARAISSSSNLIRTPSFLDGRTQSQDRAPRSSGLQENSLDNRMTKTVSFNFDERRSRLSDFQTSLSQKEREKQNIHQDYFKR